MKRKRIIRKGELCAIVMGAKWFKLLSVALIMAVSSCAGVQNVERPECLPDDEPQHANLLKESMIWFDLEISWKAFCDTYDPDIDDYLDGWRGSCEEEKALENSAFNIYWALY